MNKRLKLALRLGFSAVLMAILLIWLVDLPAAWRGLKGARWDYLLWLLLVVLADRVVMSEKWRWLVLCRARPLGFWEALKSYLLATFAGYFLPSTVGADAVRVVAVSRRRKPDPLIGASVLAERTLAFPAAALAAVVGVALLAGLAVELPPSLMWWALSVLTVTTLAAGLSLFGPLGRWLEGLEERTRGRNPLLAWLGRFARAYALYRNQRGVLFIFFAATFFEQLAPIAAVWLAAKALAIPLGFLGALAICPVAHMFIRLPVSFSGFGWVESLYVAFFQLVGLDATQSFLLGIVTSLAVVIVSLPGAVIFALGGWRVVNRAQAEVGKKTPDEMV